MIALLGDIMLGRGVNELIPNYPPEHFWGTTLPMLQSADAVIANLECAVTTHLNPWTKTFKVFHFRADPDAVKVLKIANIKAVSLANNHSLDFEEQGLVDTLDYLDQVGIKHVGAGRDLVEARAPKILTVKGLKIGIISATDNEPPFAAGEDKPGVNYQSFNAQPASLTYLRESIEKAKIAGADLIILSLHWGPNMVQTPTADFREYAYKAIEMGVDIIHGHSAHLFQGIEFHNQGVILYNTGDFLDDYAIDQELRNDWSLIFMVEVERKKITKVKTIPVHLSYGQTNIAHEEEAKAIISRMESLSRAFGTKIEREGIALEFSPKGNSEIE